MLYYPQLTSGSICQFPIGWQATTRTISNELPSGETIRMSDPGARSIQWRLQYSSLTDNEQASIEQLFEAVEGRLGTFTFLDPTDNLLLWSEDWTKQVWSSDPMLQLSSGYSDPFGGSGAIQITNSAQAVQRVVQSLASDSSFQYCFSVYLRSDSTSVVQLLQSASGDEAREAVTVGPRWARFVKSASLSAKQDGISFGVELPAGARIFVFGGQVEAQMAPGPYKKTTDHAGVYPKTRFEADSLSITTNAPNQNACAVNLMSRL